MENNVIKEMFANGYITIFGGKTFPYKEWFKENGAKYSKLWGWAFGAGVDVPENLPSAVISYTLHVYDVFDLNGEIKSESEIKKAVENILYADVESNSQYVGEVGERLTLTVSIERIINLDGYYGPSTLYIMYEGDNCFSWITSAYKEWEVGDVINIRGTVKDHKVYRGVAQTVLNRCTEVKR